MLRVEPEIIATEVAEGNVKLAFHHMLDHGDRSNLAHRSVECAGAQDPLAFWTMHDALFEQQNQFWASGEGVIYDIVATLGLDANAMQACLADPAINEKITRMDIARRDQGVRLRPTFDVNGRLVEGSVPYSVFQQIFAETLAQ